MITIAKLYSTLFGGGYLRVRHFVICKISPLRSLCKPKSIYLQSWLSLHASTTIDVISVCKWNFYKNDSVVIWDCHQKFVCIISQQWSSMMPSFFYKHCQLLLVMALNSQVGNKRLSTIKPWKMLCTSILAIQKNRTGES